MEVNIRKVGRPKGGRLSLEEQKTAKIQHYTDVKNWKLTHPEAVEEYRRIYAIRRKSGLIRAAQCRKKYILQNTNILEALINNVKNITIE